MRRPFSFSLHEFYHLYNRGTEKRIIFMDTDDWEHFLSLLYLCNNKNPIVFRELPHKDLFNVERGETLVDIGAYCLMPNHFHILVREKIENGISNFMKKLSTAYSMYFNTKYERTGSLFEGTFKAHHADTDRYLKYLFSYIHLNPVKRIEPDWKTNLRTDSKKIFDYVNTYAYSSFQDYKNERKESIILQKNVFPEYFETKAEVNKSLIEWLSYHTED